MPLIHFFNQFSFDGTGTVVATIGRIARVLALFTVGGGHLLTYPLQKLGIVQQF